MLEAMIFFQNELGAYAPIWFSEAFGFIVALHFLAVVLVQPNPQPEMKREG